MVKLKVTILDFFAGRGFGGHPEDYLAALETALAGLEPEVITPFRDGVRVPRTRLGMYWLEFRYYRAALRQAAGEERVTIAQTAELSDYACCLLAAITIRPSRRAKCLFMLRRGPNPDSRFFEALTRWIKAMIRWRLIYPVFDSTPALEAWLALVPGAEGSLIALPPPPGAANAAPPVEPPVDGPLMAFAGWMRAEKGASHYPSAVKAALTVAPQGVVAVQVAQHDEESVAAIARLREMAAADERVRLLDRHLPAEQYQALLRAAKVVIMPYDADSYGEGTSGVVYDALVLGAVVVITRLKWVADAFGDNEQVVWLEDPGSEDSLREAIATALGRVEEVEHDAGAAAADAFRETWLAAIADARRQSD